MNFMIFSAVLGAVMAVVGASHKIVKIMEYKPKIKHVGGIKLDTYKTQGELRLQDVKFAYPTKLDVPILKGVNIEINKNRVIALVGPSGCGKSSIISMIERFYDPVDGQVLLDGTDIRQLNPRWYHQQVAIVQQEPILFSCSIKENITYGLDEN